MSLKLGFRTLRETPVITFRQKWVLYIPEKLQVWEKPGFQVASMAKISDWVNWKIKSKLHKLGNEEMVSNEI